ncbi:MAG: AI-2E family transporter [Spirochaetia bacterium]
MESSEYRSRKISNLTFFILLFVIAVVVYLLARPFLITILLAAITSGLAAPIRDRLNKKFSGKRNLTAGLTTFVVFVVVVVPVLAVLYLSVVELIDILASILDDIDNFRESLDTVINKVSRTLPFINGLSSRNIISSEAISNYIETEGARLMEGFGNMMSGVANFFLMFFVFLYSLFFFIKDGPNILKGLMSLVPLPLNEKEMIVNNFIKVTRASLKGIFVIGVLQGFIGGILFFILGLPSPILFGVLFLILAAIPNFGAILIWLPTGIVLLFSGEIAKGIIMMTLGGLIIAAVDYLVRPRIIRGGTKVHEILVLIGIFGGIAVFGVFGFIIGPIIIAVFKEILRIFSSRFHDEIHQIA